MIISSWQSNGPSKSHFGLQLESASYYNCCSNINVTVKVLVKVIISFSHLH